MAFYMSTGHLERRPLRYAGSDMERTITSKRIRMFPGALEDPPKEYVCFEVDKQHHRRMGEETTFVKPEQYTQGGNDVCVGCYTRKMDPEQHTCGILGYMRSHMAERFVHVIAIEGPNGAGKSTLLDEVEARTRGGGYYVHQTTGGEPTFRKVMIARYGSNEFVSPGEYAEARAGMIKRAVDWVVKSGTYDHVFLVVDRWAQSNAVYHGIKEVGMDQDDPYHYFKYGFDVDVGAKVPLLTVTLIPSRDTIKKRVGEENFSEKVYAKYKQTSTEMFNQVTMDPEKVAPADLASNFMWLMERHVSLWEKAGCPRDVHYVKHYDRERQHDPAAPDKKD